MKKTEKMGEARFFATERSEGATKLKHKKTVS